MLKKLYLLLVLFFTPFLTTQALAADCTDITADDATTTISADCTDLDISGDDTTTTINSGVTVNTINTSTDYALTFTGSTSGYITNNGTINSQRHYSLYNNNGTITTLTNAGTISATNNSSLYNTGTITTITNSGTISAGDYGIYNTGTITTITNSSTISATDDLGLYNSGTITTLTNSGTISAGDDNGISNAGTITTLTNSSTGTISAADLYGIWNTDTITTLTNSGTISAGDDYGIGNYGGTITTLTNSGTISAGRDGGIWNTNSGTITTLTNSGTISAADDYAIYNQSGTITTLTNTGTLSAGTDKIDIYNLGTITTFNNDQGKVGSDYIEWKSTLPVNYNIIINSTSDYGITNFTSPSGTLNFGIYSSSTINDSYYSNVLTGLSSSYINNDSGSTTINGTTYTWNLKNPSGTIWDLYVVSDTSTNLSLTSEVAPTLRTAFNFADTMSFAHINTYDCDTFGTHNWCFSVGGRGTMIANANASKHSSAFLLGKKFSDQFRVALFYDHNHDYYDSKNMIVDKQQPMVGGSLVWNQKDNHSGYEMKLSHAFQQQNLALTRPKVGVSFKGTGQTQMTAYDTAAEVKYNYQQNTLTVSPYGVLRYSNKTIDSFTETTADYPLTYNEISAKTLALIAGVKFIKPLTTSINLNGALAVNHNIHHTIDNLIPSGMNGLQRIDLEDDYTATLPIASLGLEYSISGGHSIATTVQHQALSYQSMSETNIYVQYAFAL